MRRVERWLSSRHDLRVGLDRDIGAAGSVADGLDVAVLVGG